ncbi:MAG: nucleotidyl transferase AbiEii/AbiGii toxin family protein [Candidatus Woesearchaeota archaeon]
MHCHGTASYSRACLRIAYELERASEDLDFNTSLPIQGLKDTARACLKDFGRLNLQSEILAEKMHEGKYRIEIRFQGPLFTGDNRSSNTVKTDFNRRKTQTSEPRVVKKLFSDIPPFTILVMQKKEILAEKIRALAMRSEARDMYDVWALLSMGEEIDQQLLKS